jgi:chitin disaccharide deacetylase
MQTYHRLILTLLLLPSAPCAIAQLNDRYVIIHSDDAGMSHSVNMATQIALEKGTVSSASMMVPCPWFKEFAAYAKEHPQYDYGIHLTLNSEWNVYRWGPVAPSDQVASLVDPEGYLWKGVDEVARHAKADEVKIELKAQIDKALAFGVPLSHLDTHMGALVSRPDLVAVYVELAQQYDLPILFFKSLSKEMRTEYPAIAERFETSVAQLTERKLPLLDGLLQFYGGNNLELREKTYFDALKNLKPGVTQLIIHCGYDNDELRAITDSSVRRDHDRRLFTEDKTQQWINDERLKIITWRQFRELAYPK